MERKTPTTLTTFNYIATTQLLNPIFRATTKQQKNYKKLQRSAEKLQNAPEKLQRLQTDYKKGNRPILIIRELVGFVVL